jgi:hypothetical protein
MPKIDIPTQITENKTLIEEITYPVGKARPRDA